MAGFSDSSFALAMRDVIEKFVREFVQRERPEIKYGRAISYNVFNGMAQVLLTGDTETIQVFCPGGIGPSKTDLSFGENEGNLVRVAGKPGAYYMEGVQGGATQHANPVMLNPEQKGGVFFTDPVWRRFTKSFTRPVTIGQTRQFFWLDLGSGLAIGDVGWVELTIRHTFFTSTSKRYRINYNGQYSDNTTDAWYKIIPYESTGPYNADDFEIEVRNTNSPRVLAFRIRTIGDAGGFSSDSFEALIEVYGQYAKENPYNVDSEDQVTTEPTAMYGSTRTVGRFTGIFGAPEMLEGQRFQYQLANSTGTAWTNNSLKWTRMLAVPGLTSMQKVGYFYIDMPTVGTVIPVFGSNTKTSVTVTTDGVPMADAWETLWYQPPWGAVNGNSVNGNFRITQHTEKYPVPSDWIMVAKRQNVSPQSFIQLGSGDRLSIPTILPLIANWAGYGGAYDTDISWLMVSDSVVYVEGLARNNTGVSAPVNTVIATLPAGARPRVRKGFSSPTGGGATSRIDIDTNGQVILGTAIGISSFIFLDVSFIAGN